MPDCKTFAFRVTGALLVQAAMFLPSLQAAENEARKPMPEGEPFVVWMQSIHDDWAVPGYAELDRNSRSLERQLAQLCSADPDTQNFKRTLPASQWAWRDTMLVWRRLEALQFGPTLASKTSKRIDSWPTRPKTIELAAKTTADAPTSGPDAEIAMGRWSTAAQGLPALEWLLFPAIGETSPPALRSPVQCRYAQRAAYLVTVQAERLLSAWRAEAARWHSAPPSDLRRDRYMTLNLLVGSVELLRGRKLEKALRLQTLGPANRREERLDHFDGMRSLNTQRFLVAHVEGVAQMLLGASPALDYTAAGPAWGLADVLIAEKRGQANAEALRDAIVALHAAVSALPDDALNWSPLKIAPATRALDRLRGVIDPAIAKLWQVPIEFTDADGD